MNKKLKIISISLILLLLTFQYSVVLEGQKALPSEEWSRSLPINISSGNYANIQSVPNENGYTIRLLDFKKMDVLDCSADMDCSLKWSNTELNPYKNTWSDGETTYFIQDDSLIRSKNGSGNTEIASNVEDFKKSNNTLVYWTKDHQVMIQQDDQKHDSFKSEFPVNTSFILEDHVFIIIKTKKENQYAVLDALNGYKEIFQVFINPTENLSSFQISGRDGQYKLLADSINKSGGASNKVIRQTQFDLSENQSPSLEQLEFVDKESGSELFNLSSPVLYEGENGTKLTFSAYIYDQAGDKTNKLFEGNYDSSVIEASALTKKGDYYTHPIFLNDQTIAYFKLDGKEKSLMYSSKTKEKRLLSQNFQLSDFKNALFTFVTLLFNGLLLVLLAFTWILPSLGLGYLLLALLQKMRIPLADLVAFYTTTILLTITQIFLFKTMFHPERILLNAPYLTEVSHVYLVIIGAGIGSLLPVFLSNTKVIEDNFNQMILYMTTLNLLIIFFLLGPYFI